MKPGRTLRTFASDVRRAWAMTVGTATTPRTSSSYRQAASREIDALDRRPGGRLDGLAPGVSVIVATYRGRGHIDRALRSLAAQTLDRGLFEIVVVANGEPDGTIAVVEEFRRGRPDLTIRVVEQRRPGNSLARNAGAAAARREHLCWVDDDDEVSPGYLRALLGLAGPGVVPVAHLVDLHPDGTRDAGNPLSAAIRAKQGRSGLLPEDLYAPLVFDACKLLPTWLVREVGYDCGLTSGQDVVFNAEILTLWDFTFSVAATEADATYCRHVRDDSLSRQELTFDFAVAARLDVIERLDMVLPRAAGRRAMAVEQLILSQAGFIARYLRQEPGARARIEAEVGSRPLTAFPHEVLGTTPRKLVVSYCFPPFADTAGVVTAKRIHEEGVPCDVVSNDMTAVRQTDQSVSRIAGALVCAHHQIDAATTFASWNGIAEFCRKGSKAVADSTYETIYSRAMWPASHFLAALLRIRRPHVPWTAEFSDPVRHDVTGKVRFSPVADDAVLAELRDGVVAAGFAPPGDGNVYAWCEVLAYALADEIVFTNENQRSFMLTNCPEDLRDRARRVSVVRQQPTLPPRYYDLAQPDLSLDPQHVNIGYFGAFYATRGVQEVLEALEVLEREQGDRIRLHVFTTKPQDLRAALRGRAADRLVLARPYVPYLDFLALTRRLDVLLVNDASASAVHGLNPYLPSKWSDYQGSGTPVWALVEPGSVLSTKHPDFMSPVGDVEAAIATLGTIVSNAQLPKELA